MWLLCNGSNHPPLHTFLKLDVWGFSYFFAVPIPTGMFSSRCGTLIVFSICLLTRTLVSSIRRCGPDICRDDEICCENTRSAPCCSPSMDQTYYNIAMVTRKLSGVLILLLLFALGYFIQRMLCSRYSPPQNGPPRVTTSQEMLMESCSRDTLADLPPACAPAAKLPTYDQCRDLPTYEETMTDRSRGRAGPSAKNGETVI